MSQWLLVFLLSCAFPLPAQAITVVNRDLVKYRDGTELRCSPENLGKAAYFPSSVEVTLLGAGKFLYLTSPLQFVTCGAGGWQPRDSLAPILGRDGEGRETSTMTFRDEVLWGGIWGTAPATKPVMGGAEQTVIMSMSLEALLNGSQQRKLAEGAAVDVATVLWIRADEVFTDGEGRIFPRGLRSAGVYTVVVSMKKNGSGVPELTAVKLTK